MKLGVVKLVYFSPTGTTRAIAQAVARGIAADVTEILDITRPEARRQPLQTAPTDLLVLAAPVYGGRIPGVAAQWLQTMRARQTPAACLAVYGNRAYEDALLELTDLAKTCGCAPLAGAAYVGEHSFSTAESPVAPGRPDAADLAHAEAFGQQVRAKLEALASVADIPALHVPGNVPYKDGAKPNGLDFIAVSDTCTQCGLCAAICPVEAIAPKDSRAIDLDACIRCCACIKSCPEHAKSAKPGKLLDITKWLHANCQARKAPETFL